MKKTNPLIKGKKIRLAMLGMVEGNGHPYSWSAIFNGFDPVKMAKCPYSAIPIYLNKQPKDSFGIDNAKVTHIWTDNPEDARLVAKASLIPHIVESPEDVIGKVDAVIISTDKGGEHIERCKPFIKAGLPIFVDKPLTDNESDLKIFCQWVKDGVPLLSSSCMRYCKEFAPFQYSTSNLGQLRFASITMPKNWESYGIHGLESIYPILGSGFLSVRNIGTTDRNIVHFTHKSGIDVIAVVNKDMFGAFGVLQLCGTAGNAHAAMSDTFYAFKTQLAAFIQFLRTGLRPFPFSETVELMKMVIAGIKSREQNGREVRLSEIQPGDYIY